MSKMELCTDGWDATYLHMTCIHEAGHAAVARHLGCYAYWTIYCLPEGRFNPEAEHRWLGRTWSNAGDLTEKCGRKIGLAGVVAECIYENPDVCAHSIAGYLDDEIVVPSPSDWDLAAGYSFRDLSETVRLVQKLMPKIRGEAECFLLGMEKAHG